MPRFHYKAINKNGKTQRGSLEADSARLALQILQESALTPIHLEEARSASARFGPSFLVRGFGQRGVPAVEVSGAVRQLTTLLAAGLPLDEALAALCAGDSKGRLHEVLSSVRTSIMEGVSFADSLARFPHIFSSTFVAMIRAGEASGTLDVVLDRFAGHMEEQTALTRKVRAALAYPLLMLVVGSGVVIFLLVFVVPKVTQIFIDMKRTLPFPTRVLLAISDAVSTCGWFLPVVLVGLGLMLWRWLRTPSGTHFKDTFLLRAPALRGIYRPLIVGRMARTLGMLLKNSVPLLKALRIVRSVSDNGVLDTTIDNMSEGVQAGKDLSCFMDNRHLFSSVERQMVAAGERGGQLGEMLLWVARDCESRVASQLQVAASLLEPLMILALGGVVGFVVIAIMLPLFEMSSLAG